MISAICFIISTASTGYLPVAVSPESMTASVPSRMALATSLASARVGRGCSTIDCSICVAVMTGLPTSLQAAMMRFCSSGNSCGGISMPRSPRATIRPSAASRMAIRFSIASLFSILAMMGIWRGRRSISERSSSTS